MNIILVGAYGALGSWLLEDLRQRHEVWAVGRSDGDVKADITDPESLRAMYDEVGEFDAVVCAAGTGFFGPFEQMGIAEFRQGLDSKLMGQVHLLLEGRDRIADRGSFTFTSGILSVDPVPGAANLSAVNGALESFARAAAIELRRGVRVNCVSPGLIEASAQQMGRAFPGHVPVPRSRVVAAYRKCIEGAGTGQVVTVH